MHAFASRLQDSLPERMGKIAAIVILSTILYGFFDRVAFFHDEIINTGKASVGRVLDYAMRPLFYAINTLAVKFLGAHPLAISFVMVAFFFAGGLYTYRYLYDRFGTMAAVSGIAAYAWLGWAYTIGIAAMPQMVPAVFLLAAWFYYQAEPVEQFSGAKIARVASLLWAAILSHPTALAVVIPFCSAIGIRLLLAVAKNDITPRHFFRLGATWVLIFVGAFLGTELVYQVFAHDQSFIGSWVDGLDKTSGLRYERYFKPFSYYFLLIAERISPLLGGVAFLWCGAGFVGVSVERKGSQRSHANYKDMCMQVGELLAVALASLCIVSFQSWKFERVLPGFMPLLMLAIVAAFNLVARKFAFSNFVKCATAVLVILCSFWQFSLDVEKYKGQADRKRGVYSSLFEQVRSLPENKIAYVGHPSLARTLRYPIQAADKQLVEFGVSGDDQPVGRSIVASMRAAGYHYVVLSLSEKSPKSGQLRTVLKKAGMQRKGIYYGGAYELWELRKLK